ncbi:low affinity immunoglobulin epsilon Fc receptor-like isoform X2 [Erpetoichthys calabaricus]|uniref:low affinity immunoglobulin epsilon Fc receptor-like isoform X2 n=1 Tax=Erpetoichthys calabaricus TaxID=27687 RepID=UPI002234B7F1|nr:low affinity immunoglobulin epsilon Fc receptor-like isoform X2 [Erpetoichthys calabaricus]
MAEEVPYTAVSFTQKKIKPGEPGSKTLTEPNDNITYAVVVTEKKQQQKEPQRAVPVEDVTYENVGKIFNPQQEDANCQVDAYEFHKDNDIYEAYSNDGWKKDEHKKQSNGKKTPENQKGGCLKLLLLLLCAVLLSVVSSLSVYYVTVGKFKENEDALHVNLIRIQKKFKNLQENFTVLQQNVTQLKNESSALNENYKKLQSNKTRLEDYNQKLLSNITQLENYNMKLLSNITELEKDNGELQSSYVELHSTISSLNKSHTELILRFRDLDEFCPVTDQLTQARKCSVCPNEWLQSNRNCYYFSTDKLNWDDSRKQCTSMNGHLVIIESKEEQTFLINTIKTNVETTEKIYWIGLSDQEIDGQFVWVDNRPLDVNIRFWGKRQNDNGTEPDHWTDELNNPFGQNCVCLQKKKPSSGWYGLNCENQKKRICEAAASTFPSRI